MGSRRGSDAGTRCSLLLGLLWMTLAGGGSVLVQAADYDGALGGLATRINLGGFAGGKSVEVIRLGGGEEAEAGLPGLLVDCGRREDLCTALLDELVELYASGSSQPEEILDHAVVWVVTRRPRGAEELLEKLRNREMVTMELEVREGWQVLQSRADLAIRDQFLEAWNGAAGEDLQLIRQEWEPEVESEQARVRLILRLDSRAGREGQVRPFVESVLYLAAQARSPWCAVDPRSLRAQSCAGDVGLSGVRLVSEGEEQAVIYRVQNLDLEEAMMVGVRVEVHARARGEKGHWRLEMKSLRELWLQPGEMELGDRFDARFTADAARSYRAVVKLVDAKGQAFYDTDERNNRQVIGWD